MKRLISNKVLFPMIWLILSYSLTGCEQNTNNTKESTIKQTINTNKKQKYITKQIINKSCKITKTNKYDYVDSPTYSPNGKSFAFVAKKKWEWIIVKKDCK